MLRLGSPVVGTTNVKNAEISIDADDVNALMLGPETIKVYVGGSVAVLKDALNKGGQAYEETRKGGAGAGGGVAAAEIANKAASASSCRRAWKSRQLQLRHSPRGPMRISPGSSRKRTRTA